MLLAQGGRAEKKRGTWRGTVVAKRKELKDAQKNRSVEGGAGGLSAAKPSCLEVLAKHLGWRLPTRPSHRMMAAHIPVLWVCFYCPLAAHRTAQAT